MTSGQVPAGFVFPGSSFAFQLFLQLFDSFGEIGLGGRNRAFLDPGDFIKRQMLEKAQREASIAAASVGAQGLSPGERMDAELWPLGRTADETEATLYMLLGAVVFILIIACANVANLLLSRGATRQREVAIRGALGASRSRLVRQFLVESLTLSAAGAAAAMVLAWWGVRLIPRILPPRLFLFYWDDLSVNS